MPDYRLSTVNEDGESFARVMVHLLSRLVSVTTIQYLLLLVDDILSLDDIQIYLRPGGAATSKAILFTSLLSTSEPVDAYAPFLKHLLQQENPFVQQKAAHALARFMAVAGEAVPQQHANEFMLWFSKHLMRMNDPSLSSTLGALATALQQPRFRALFHKVGGLHGLVRQLRTQKHPQLRYQVLFCLWMLTFNDTISKDLVVEHSIVSTLLFIIKDSLKEKVVRLSVANLRNLLNNGALSGARYNRDFVRVIKGLSQKKWQDEEMISDIDALSTFAEEHVQMVSTMEQYRRDVSSCQLEWSPLHRSEAFWKENFAAFEKDNRLMQDLILLLGVDDPVTVSLACHDLGQLCIAHPNGRRLVEKYGAKLKVVGLMSHSDPEVQKEALLCVQRLMVNKWEFLGSADSKAPGSSAAGGGPQSKSATASSKK